MATSNSRGLCRLPHRQHLAPSPWISPCPGAWECLLHSPRRPGHPGSHLVLGSAEWTGGLRWADTTYTQKLPCAGPGQATQNVLRELPLPSGLVPHCCLSTPQNPIPSPVSALGFPSFVPLFLLFPWSAFPTTSKGLTQMPCFHKAFPGTPSSHALSCL